MRRTVVALPVLALLLGSAPAASAAVTATGCRPRVLDLGTVPGGRSSEVLAGNGDVLVGGAHDAQDRERAVRWVGGVIQDLGAGSDAWAADVDASGVIVGNMHLSRQPLTTERAFRWRDGRLVELPGLGGATFVRRTNDRGIAAGSAEQGADGRELPVVWRHGVLHRLPLPARWAGGAGLGVNHRGDVVGLVYSRTQALAWLWPATGGGLPLDGLGGFSQANVVDDAGRAYGLSDFGGRPRVEAATWPVPGQARGLGLHARGDVSSALGAATHGTAVGAGNYAPGGQGEHVLLSDVRERRARTLLPLSGSYRDASKAHYVSDAEPVSVGGSSQARDGSERATLWTCARQQAFVAPVTSGAAVVAPAAVRPDVRGLRR